jgi:hypothetical protein
MLYENLVTHPLLSSRESNFSDPGLDSACGWACTILKVSLALPGLADQAAYIYIYETIIKKL